MSLTDALGRFCSDLATETLPPAVVEKVRVCLLNGYGIGLGCKDTPYAPVAGRAAEALTAGEQFATILTSGTKAGLMGAALANSALFHGRGQEDTCGAAHLGTILIPMLTAMMEARRYPMERLIPSLVAGYETGGLLERAMAAATTPRGLRSTSLYGPLAAAAAAARMMNLPADQIGAAIGNAASFSAGTLQTFVEGTDECRYQVGVAGVIGLMAAELAAAGSVTGGAALEGPAGFARVFAGKDLDVATLAATLGHDWSIHRVTFKPYPVCAFNQTPVIAALEMRRRLNGRVPMGIRVRMNPYETGYAGMDSKGPFHTITGTLMSIPFCIALTVLRGAPTMEAMVTYDDGDVNGLVERTDLVTDESIPVLSCCIEADVDEETLIVDQRMTTDNFNFSRAEVSELVRRIGREQGVSDKAYDLIERFVEDLPQANLEDILEAFAL